MNDDGQRVLERLLVLEAEMQQLREGYLVVTTKYNTTLDSLKDLTSHSKTAAAEAAAAAASAAAATAIASAQQAEEIAAQASAQAALASQRATIAAAKAVHLSNQAQTFVNKMK